MAKKDDTVSIQAKLARLDELVAWFDGDEFQLEKATATLNEAAKVAADIENDLQAVINDIELIKRSFASESSA